MVWTWPASTSSTTALPCGLATKATQLQDAYKVEGTPSLGVAGRFYVNGQGPRTLVVADALIAEGPQGLSLARPGQKPAARRAFSLVQAMLAVGAAQTGIT